MTSDPRGWLGSITRFLWQGYFPVTKAVTLLSALGFFLSLNRAYVELFGFSPIEPWLRPWTFLTYIFVNGHPVSVFFGISWFLNCGGSLERAWLPRGFLNFLVYVTVVTALFMWLASLLTGKAILLTSLWLPVFACTVAFCMLNPEVSFFSIISAQTAIYIAFALAFFNFWPDMELGVFGTGGCFAAYAYVRWVRTGLCQPSRTVGWRGRMIEIEPPPAPAAGRNWNPVNAFMRWKRKRDFQRLMRKSGFDDRGRN